MGAGRHRRGRIPAPQYCEESPQAGRVIGRSLFVRVSVVWRTNLEVPPSATSRTQAQDVAHKLVSAFCDV